ncbi:putative reverse transcriptase domain-containing protein [Tanacetum coccineum]|uniref:Reverse transcriptase domain-containing protein n=1 Tax=Tanacetum coccineum TaxID=301880 RepID=A0ABQ5AE24_9ASTR
MDAKSLNFTAGNAPGKSSYANITSKPSAKKVNVHTLFTLDGNGIDVVVLLDSIRAISERFANTAYGFFLGKRVAYPVVANYVRNTWGKYRLVRSMFSSSTGLFSFQFCSIEGLDAMLENGPWFICNNPLILKKWHPDENLLKEDVSTVPVWVKLHGVPATAFSEDDLSAIATKLGTPLMLDSYASDKCMQSGKGTYTCNVRVEYEWKPPRCTSCKVFGHIHEECPKNTGAGEKKTVKKPSQTSQGVPVGPKMAFKSQKEYQPIIKKPNASSSGNKKKGVEPTIEVSNSNLFDVLNSVDHDVEFVPNGGQLIVQTSSLDSIKFPWQYKLYADSTKSFSTVGSIKLQEDLFLTDSYPDNDNYDPNDDDMYKNHDLSEYLQSICDDLDITVRGRKKK